MPAAKKYATAGAFRRALEERLKATSMNEQTDLNRLRRQVSFDRLLARLFRHAAPPWLLKGGYALELRYKAARSTVDIDLTVQSISVSAGEEPNQIVREMLQSAADVSLGDWFEFTFGAPTVDDCRSVRRRSLSSRSPYGRTDLRPIPPRRRYW